MKIFPNVMVKAGLKQGLEIEHYLTEVEHQSVTKSHSSGLRTALLFYFIAAAKHGPYNKEERQRLRRAL